MQEITEGKARIYVNDSVFYNPKMKTLRDVSVSFLKAVGCRNKRLLDATAATGVRAIRYAKECGVKDIVALDINKDAYDICKRNIRLNDLKIEAKNASIREFAASCKDRFGIIDFDPFGSPAPDLSWLMGLCWDGTAIMITATDTAVLCGAHHAACIKIYGSRPLHNELCKEVGIRILLNYASRTAAQFNFGIVPILSISDMHYMRIFLRLEFGATRAVDSVKSCGLGSFCRKCYRFSFARGVAPSIRNSCPACASQAEQFGPLWLGQLYDKRIVSKMLKNNDVGIMKTISNELDVPLFYSMPRITRLLGSSSVSHYRVIDALRKARYRATQTQFDPEGIKTDADSEQVIGIAKRL